MIRWDVSSPRLDVFRFGAKKPVHKKSLFRLKFAIHILPAKPGNFNLKRVLEKGYFIFIKWLCYIYRQLDCHCYNLQIFLSHQFQVG